MLSVAESKQFYRFVAMALITNAVELLRKAQHDRFFKWLYVY